MARKYKWEFARAKKPDSDLMNWLYSQFVLGCPVDRVSVRARSLKSLGWISHDIHCLLQSMQTASSLTNERWRWEETDGKEGNLFLNSINKLGCQDGYTLENEFLVYARAGKGKAEGAFYLIRNALAHGSFKFHRTNGTEYLALETRNQEKLRGRAVLRVETLRKWRQLLNTHDAVIKSWTK